jgi:excinuclease ABC subunit B
MYADHVTAAMKYAMDETSRRRTLQEQYNKDHGIIPQTVVRAVLNINPAAGTTDYYDVPRTRGGSSRDGRGKVEELDASERIAELRAEMFAAAENLEFEKAARLRDELRILDRKVDGDGAPKSSAPAAGYNPYTNKRKTGTRLKTGKAATSEDKNWKAKQRRSSKFKP